MRWLWPVLVIQSLTSTGSGSLTHQSLVLVADSLRLPATQFIMYTLALCESCVSVLLLVIHDFHPTSHSCLSLYISQVIAILSVTFAIHLITAWYLLFNQLFISLTNWFIHTCRSSVSLLLAQSFVLVLLLILRTCHSINCLCLSFISHAACHSSSHSSSCCDTVTQSCLLLIPHSCILGRSFTWP